MPLRLCALIVELVLSDYAGAGTRLEPHRGLALSPLLYAFSPKIDGCYARLSTDHTGRIARVLSRTGSSHRPSDLDGLLGLAIGLPDAVLHGELEAHTEAGIAAARARGYSALHLFDVSRWCGRDVAARSYSDRHGLLHRWQANVECYAEVPRHDWWRLDDQGDAHDPITGRYVRPVPQDLRRLPIVPLHRGKGAGEQLWRSHVELGGGEGLVAVRLDAPLGARGSKRKIKATEQLDVTVVQAGSRAAVVTWRGRSFTVSAAGKRLAIGEVWALDCDGFHGSGEPRFARLSHRREDLAAVM